MDSTQDLFTRRMLRRASVRRNRGGGGGGGGSLRSSHDDSRRKSSMLQAIDDQPVKIADVADSRGASKIQIGENTIAEEKGRAMSRANRTTSDGLISRRRDLPNVNWRSQRSSSHLIGQSRVNVDCQNSQDLREPSDAENSRATAKSNCVKSSSKENCKEHLNFETVAASRAPRFPGSESTEYSDDKSLPMNWTNGEPSLAKIILPIPANQGRIVANDIPVEKFAGKKSATDGGGWGYGERGNGLDLTRTLDSTSMNMTGNTMNDALQTTPTYMKGFELGNVKWRGPLYAACALNNMHKKKNDRFVEWSLNDRERTKPSQSELRTPEEPELVTTVQREILPPMKTRAELKRVGKFKQEAINDGVESSRINSSANKRPDKISLMKANVDENSDSPLTPLTTEIKKLDADILRLDFNPSVYTPGKIVDLSPPDRIYPNLSEIKFSPSSGCSPKNIYESTQSPVSDYAESPVQKLVAVPRNKNSSNYHEHIVTSLATNPSRKNVHGNDPRMTNLSGSKCPKAEDTENGSNKLFTNTNDVTESDKFKPNLESTRKSPLTNVSKDAGSPQPRESITVSSVTLPPTSPTSVGNAGTSSTPNEKTLDSTVPYDVDNFLADALGDELYNTTVTYPPSETHDKSISQFNASELISEERTPISKRVKTFLKKTPMTEPPSRQTSTFDRTMTIYRSLTQRIKNKLRPGLRSMPKTVANDAESTVETMSEDKKIQALLLEANIQRTLMYQANKALTLCRSTKEFFASTEQVEFERLLLVAELRKISAYEEIRKLQDSELNNNDQGSSEKGEVTIKDLSLALKEDVLDDESRQGDFVEWFVVVISHRETVWATRPISCPVQSPRIIFPDRFTVENLTPNFRITVKIYSLKLRRATFSHDDKYHLNKTERHSRCPSPKKIRLRRAERSLPAIQNSSFVLSGTLELFLHDLMLASPWPLTSLTPGSVLHGTIDLTLSCQLHLSVSHCGFVTYGEEAGGFASWNRRWCVLQGRTLMFWNYPCDQEDKDPLATVDLANCISSEINIVDRSLCAKPRTLMIETARRRNILDRNSLLLECRLSCTIIRKLLCCDTVEDLNQWKSKLNRVITALRDWNITSRLPREQVSDL